MGKGRANQPVPSSRREIKMKVGNIINVQVHSGLEKQIHVAALIDTGACESVVAENFLHKLKIPVTPLQRGDCRYRITADGHPVKVVGSAILTLDIWGEAMPFKFTVFKQASNNLILGDNFLAQNGAHIDFVSRVVTFFGNSGIETELCINNRCEQTGLAMLGQAVALPPMSETQVRVKLSKGVGNSVCLIQSLLGRGAAQVLVSRALVKPRNRWTVCQILNNTDKVIHLNKYARVAKFETYNDANHIIANTQDWFDEKGNLRIDEQIGNQGQGYNNSDTEYKACDLYQNIQVNALENSELNPEAKEFIFVTNNDANIEQHFEVETEDIQTNDNIESQVTEAKPKDTKRTKHVTFNLDNNKTENSSTAQNQSLETLSSLGVQIEKNNLTQEQYKQIEQLIQNNSDVFAKKMTDIPGSKMFYHHIDTGDSRPIYTKPYRNSPLAKAEIEKQTAELSEANIIEESTSMWNSPLILTKKKDGSYRFCLDFRKLNEVTKPISFPLPTMLDVVDALSEAKPVIFSSLDLKSGFFQIPLDEESRDKTSFTTHQGSYRMTRLGMGMKNSPSSFQMLMGQVFKGLTFKFLTIYIDDILVYSKDFDTHMKHLEVVFQRLRGAGLRLHPKKCTFAMSKILYLGHIVSSQGIAVDPSKVEVVKSYPRPNSVREVRAFLGLTGYYRKFQKGYAKLASPLFALLRKDAKFQWDSLCEESFLKLREAMTCTPVLAYPDLSKEFILTTDASLSAIGYILSQKDENGLEHPIAYSGRALRGSERNWSVTEVEGLALVTAVQEFRPYLMHNSFTLMTDHISLTWLKTIKNTHGRLFRWSILLQAYDMKILHKSGKTNLPADALSRREYPPPPPEDPDDDVVNDALNFATLQPNTATVEINFEYQGDEQQAETSPMHIAALGDNMENAQRTCPDLGPIIRYLENGELPEDDKAARRIVFQENDFHMNNNLLYHMFQPTTKQLDQIMPVVEQICLPQALRVEVLQQYHDHNSHPGFDRCYAAIRLKYFWSKMFSDIKTYCFSCTVCQRAKIHTNAKKAPLQPLPPAEIFSRYHIDYLGPLKTTKEGYKYILLVVESLSRYPEAFPTRTQEAGETANVLYNEIFCRYGCPRTLLSDRGTNFCSQLVTQLCKLMNVARVKTSSFHPQTNSMCENFNRTIWKSLRTHIGDTEQDKWAEYLPSVLAAFRATPALSSTGLAPFYVLYGTHMVLPLDNDLEVPSSGKYADAENYVKQLVPKVQIMRKIAQENVEQSQVQYKTQYDKNAKEPSYEVGDRVWMSNPIVPKGQSKKLVQKWTGPYFITAKRGPCNYNLSHCHTYKQVGHPVHSNRLKPFNDNRDKFTNKEANETNEGTQEHDNEVEGEDLCETQDGDDAQSERLDDKQGNSKTDSKTTKLNSQTESKKTDNWHTARRLLGVKTERGKKYYRVEWEDPSSKPQWIIAENVTPYLKEQYHIRRTQTGLLRKEFRRGH